MLHFAYVEDSALLRSSLSRLIELKYGGCDIHQYEDGRDFLDKLPKENYRPSIVLMDISMPRLNGFETTAWLKKNYANVPVLVVSNISKEEAILKMLNLGARGFVSKNIQPSKLYEAIDEVMNGGTYFSTNATYTLSNGILYDRGKKIAADKQPLTKREEEILTLIGMNKTYEEIAAELYLSLGTVRTHKDNIAAKLKIPNYQNLAVYAIQIGLVCV
jgi:DNA-binding NarL/FixJ family response regulator